MQPTRAFAALTEPDPALRLREVVQRLLAEGRPREELLSDLDSIRATLRQAGQDEAEDVVLDVMDFVVGWASPHMKV